MTLHLQKGTHLICRFENRSTWHCCRVLVVIVHSLALSDSCLDSNKTILSSNNQAYSFVQEAFFPGPYPPHLTVPFGRVLGYMSRFDRDLCCCMRCNGRILSGCIVVVGGIWVGDIPLNFEGFSTNQEALSVSTMETQSPECSCTVDRHIPRWTAHAAKLPNIGFYW